MNEYIFDDVRISHTESFEAQVKAEDMTKFSEITGDLNPLHTDKVFANSVGFKDRVVYGQLVASYLSTLAGMYLPGKYSLILSIDTSFKKPVIVNDRLTIVGEVKEKVDSTKIIVVDVTISNATGEVVTEAMMKIKVLK